MKKIKNARLSLKLIANLWKEELKIAERKMFYNNINMDNSSYNKNNKK